MRIDDFLVTSSVRVARLRSKRPEKGFGLAGGQIEVDILESIGPKNRLDDVAVVCFLVARKTGRGVGGTAGCWQIEIHVQESGTDQVEMVGLS